MSAYQRPDIVERNPALESEANRVDKEAGLKNRWRWDWLGKKADDGEIVGTFVRKLKTAGRAVCIICNSELAYGSRGSVVLTKHATTGKHVKAAKAVKGNYRIPGSMPVTAANNETITKTVAPVQDRVTTAEALVCGFVCENSLPFTLVPKVIELSKTLAKDPKALDLLSMNRVSASYKTRHGLAKTLEEETLQQLRTCFFSLNIDESTSESLKRILAILVSYFCETTKTVVVKHLASIDVVHMDSKSLHDEIVALFEAKDIPFTNLMSMLLDSCNVMRGSKTGFETRIRGENAPHLLDIDGDTCHHAHNAAKVFCKPFGGWCESLFTLLHNDMKWSVDLRELYQEVCTLVDVQFNMPERFISHRWLSAYDLSVDTVRQLDALTVFYYGFLPKAHRPQYQALLAEIYHRKLVTETAQARIREIHSTLEKKNMTEDGKKRKQNILDRLFYVRKKMRLILEVYVAVLPLLKKYVVLFQTRSPMIHKIHDEICSLLKEFLACYVKPQVINDLSYRRLQSLQVGPGNAQNLLNVEDMFMGKAKSILNCLHPSNTTVKDFKTNLKEAFSTCGMYLLKKMPILNPILRAASAIDPTCRGHDVTVKLMLRLPDLMTNVLNEEEKVAYDLEVRQYHVDANLAAPEDGWRIDEWWANQVFNKDKYTSLSKLVKALLSCFHGPQVEGSFNVMGDVISSKTARVAPETYSAIQTVKYSLRASGKSAVEYFKRDDPKFDPVNVTLVKNMRTAYKVEKEAQLKRDKERKKRLEAMALSQRTTTSATKRKAKELSMLAAKTARLAHQKNLMRK